MHDLRILLMLETPFSESPLYKNGMIDKKGRYTLNEDQQVYFLDRLVVKAKRMIGEKPSFKQLLNGFIFVKESYENGKLGALFQNRLPNGNDKMYVKDKQSFIRAWESAHKINEDGEGGVPANNMGSGNVATYEKPMMQIVKRKKSLIVK